VARRHRTDWYSAKRLVSEALERVRSVTEDPGSGQLNYQTTYTYDCLDSLRKVVQGSQTRYFGYDSLKRLIRVKNPEQDVNTYLPTFTDSVTGNTQWAVGFVYDNNSNLSTKTDPRNITCTYTYDAMNRVWTRTYLNDPNQTPAVDYKYDGAGTNGWYVVGKLTAVNTSGSFVSSYTYDTFDPMGRVLHSTQTTDGNVYGMSYGYDLAGNLISETYPSNRVVSTAFDTACRINDVSSGATHYASSFSYSAHGGVTDMKLGNNLWEHTTFEPNRLQPTEIDLGSSQGATDKLKLNYDYGSLATNNGNVMGQTITIPSGPSLTQGYTYDGVNRLLTAQENSGSSWKQTYVYDVCGNRTIDSGNTYPYGLAGANPQISGTTNRITSAGYSYDYAGNLKTDAAGHSYDYDAENMQVKYDTTVALYSYDGEGHRVKSVTNNQTLTTLFVYDAMGKMLAEYANTTPSGGGTSYLTQDALGSPRVITASNQSVKARHDYLPFGEEISVPLGGRTTGQGYVADNVRQKFTGQQRDVETGLDYFGARYYSSATGRFTSADTLGGNGANPQTANLYSYVLNNPMVMVDSSGHLPAEVYVDYNDDFRETELHDTTREEINTTPEPKLDNPVPQAEDRLRDAEAAKAPVIYIVFMGVLNGRLDNANANADVVQEWQGVQQYQVIPITNDNTVKGLTGAPNTQAAAYGMDIINNAIKEFHFKPEQIILVGHSNGVPTMNATLANFQGMKFQRTILLGPNTGDIKVLQNIVKSASSSLIAMSSKDPVYYPPWWAIAAGYPGNGAPHLSASAIEKGLQGTGLVVVDTKQDSHYLPQYVGALKTKCGKCP
jgi:RHS repeat-associated protein